MKYFLAIAVLLISLSSCSISQDDISFKNVKKVDVQGVTMSQVRLTLDVEIANASRMKITVKEGMMMLHDAAGDIAEITIREGFELPKKSVTVVKIPITIKFKGSLGALSAMSRLNGDLNSILVSGNINVKAKSINKKMEVKDITLKQFMAAMGINDLKSLNLPL